MQYLLGTDIGTSGTKTIMMDTTGKLISQDLQEYEVLTPKPLWAEQWPDVWLEAGGRGSDPYDHLAGALVSGKDAHGGDGNKGFSLGRGGPCRCPAVAGGTV